ncbi:MAG: NUDIX domain-containing protein [Bdellovibrionales bacterium]|nr:NUDIX domain-containing protein [Bdellovibrionales bacterium]
MSSIREFGNRVAGITYVERPGSYAFLFNSDKNLAVISTGFGLFLPGGGNEPGEDALTALKREIFEEIAYTVTSAHVLGQAAQFHWSSFYQQHFRKVGTFFLAEATAPATPRLQKDHTLQWLTQPEAARLLTQEFQRWATSEFL